MHVTDGVISLQQWSPLNTVYAYPPFGHDNGLLDWFCCIFEGLCCKTFMHNKFAQKTGQWHMASTSYPLTIFNKNSCTGNWYEPNRDDA